MNESVKVAKLPNCDFCHSDELGIPFRLAKYDGKTKMGPWANMCDPHFAIYGVGLGTGRGQRLVLEDDHEEES